VFSLIFAANCAINFLSITFRLHSIEQKGVLFCTLPGMFGQFFVQLKHGPPRLISNAIKLPRQNLHYRMNACDKSNNVSNHPTQNYRACYQCVSHNQPHTTLDVTVTGTIHKKKSAPKSRPISGNLFA
jgi:hypothetical protein